MRKAKDALDNLNGLELDGRDVRLDFAKGPRGGGASGGGGGGDDRRGARGGGGRGELLRDGLHVNLLMYGTRVCIYCKYPF